RHIAYEMSAAAEAGMSAGFILAAPLAIAADHQYCVGQTGDGIDEEVQPLEVMGAIEPREKEDGGCIGQVDAPACSRPVAGGGKLGQVDAGGDHGELTL